MLGVVAFGRNVVTPTGLTGNAFLRWVASICVLLRIGVAQLVAHINVALFTERNSTAPFGRSAPSGWSLVEEPFAELVFLLAFVLALA